MLAIRRRMARVSIFVKMLPVATNEVEQGLVPCLA